MRRLGVVRSDREALRRDLFDIARTTLSSKVLTQDKDYFANLAVDSVLRLKVQPSQSLKFYRELKLGRH
jgi:chaperonin GroEL (HSP60 family)